MNPANRQRWLGWVAAVALAGLVGDRLILTPLVASYRARARQIVELRQKVTQGAVLLERETAIRERWEFMRTNTLSREVSVAEGQLLQAFDRWSRESGVSITSLRPQWKQGDDDLVTLECRDAFGNLASLSRFLYLIERDPLGVRIEAIVLTARDSEAQQLNLNLQVSALMLRKPGS